MSARAGKSVLCVAGPRAWASLCLVAVLLPTVLLSTATARAQQIPLVSPDTGAPPEPSALTVRVLAIGRPTVDVLDRASRLAAERAAAPRLRALARRETTRWPTIADALASVAAPTLVGHDPLDAAAVGAAAIDEGAETILSVLPRVLRTPGARAIAADRAIATQGAADLAALAQSDGKAFDALYGEIERTGLERLLALFRAYARNGDDPRLLAAAVHALPGLKAALQALP